MTRIIVPSDAASFEKLREQAPAIGRKPSAPKPTLSIVQDRESSAGPKLEGPGPKAPEDPRPRPAAPASSSGREQPARIPETPRADEGRELEPEEPDLVELLHGRWG